MQYPRAGNQSSSQIARSAVQICIVEERALLAGLGIVKLGDGVHPLHAASGSQPCDRFVQPLGHHYQSPSAAQQAKQ